MSSYLPDLIVNISHPWHVLYVESKFGFLSAHAGPLLAQSQTPGLHLLLSRPGLGPSLNEKPVVSCQCKCSSPLQNRKKVQRRHRSVHYIQSRMWSSLHSCINESVFSRLISVSFYSWTIRKKWKTGVIISQSSRRDLQFLGLSDQQFKTQRNNDIEERKAAMWTKLWSYSLLHVLTFSRLVQKMLTPQDECTHGVILIAIHNTDSSSL